MNELFFENVSGVGNLYLDYVFDEFNGEPILFMCKNSVGGLYLCLCSEIRYEQRWVIIKCSTSLL